MAMEYRYYMTQRPPMPGALPKAGLQGIIENDPDKPYREARCRVYAVLVYSRELTEKEISDYELVKEEE
jgi:hypothetical protein